MKFFFLTFILLIFSFSILRAAETISATDPFTKSVINEFDKHNYKKLIKLYEDYREKNPQKYLPLKTRMMYCQALADVGDVEGAIKNLKDLNEAWPARLDIIKIQYDLANLLFMQGLKDEAKDVYEKIILQSEESSQIVQKSRERLSQLKQLDMKKKDVTSLKILEIESSLEIGEVGEVSEISKDNMDFLNKIALEDANSRNGVKAKLVLQKINEIRSQKYRSLLDEARRLFDEEKKYQEAQEILETIERDYPDIAEEKSVEGLKKAIRDKNKN